MSKPEISPHQVAVYLAFRNSPDNWLSNADVAVIASSVMPRTVRAHTQRLTKLGILE